MKIFYLIGAGLTASWIVGCAGLPDNAPVEFAQANEEIELANDEKVNKMFSNTLTRAEETLDRAVELYNASDEYKDPTAQGAKKKEATEEAVKARNLASNARQAHRQVTSWDADITNFTERKTLATRLSEVEEVVKGQVAKDSAGGTEFAMTTAVAFFDSGKAQLNSENRQRVAELAQTLKSNEKLEAWVIGYTDVKGSPKLNERLAAARAQAVAQELISNGVEDKQIKVRPHVAMGASDKGVRGNRQLQRKVEVRLVPTTRQAE